MKENKHNVIFIYHSIQALNTKGCDTTFFSIIHRRMIMMFRITRLSSERTVLDIDCFMHYTNHIHQDSNQKVTGGKPGG